MQTGAIVDPDMGARADLSICEMGSRGEVGIEVERLRSTRDRHDAHEIRLSESQERMRGGR